MSGVALENTCNRPSHWVFPFVWAPIDVFCGANDFRRKGPKGNLTLLTGRNNEEMLRSDVVLVGSSQAGEIVFGFATETRYSHLSQRVNNFIGIIIL